MWRTLALVCAVIAIGGCERTPAPALRVAVAANFADAFRALARRFEETTGHAVSASVGSTGKLYAQIRSGAPFAVFLSADTLRAKLLDEAGVAIRGSRFTYCIGRLVLWSPTPGLVDDAGAVLTAGSFRHLAIANPELAPYGKAAREVLRARGQWDAVEGRLVRGENIAQTFQFVESGNAALGFVAASQLTRHAKQHPDSPGSRWDVPAALHAPIAQQAVLLTDDAVARAFLAFLRSDEGRRIITKHGYGVAK